MRIVNLNAWCGVASGVTEYLTSLDADAYFLQEIVCAKDPDAPEFLSFYSEAKSNPNQDAHLWRKICNSFPHYQQFFTPARSGELLDDQKQENHYAHYGDATLIKNGIAVTDIAAGFTYGGYVDDWGDLPTPRTSHIIGVISPSGQRLVLASTHGVYTGDGKGDHPARIEQMTEFIKRIKNMLDNGYDHVIICGDFNLLPESRVFRMFNDAFGTRELVSEYNIKTTRTRLYGKRESVPFADYMLVSSGVKIKEFSVPEEPAISDHCPLILDIE